MPSGPCPIELFRPLFEPQSIAIVGASASRSAVGNLFLHCLQTQGYAGQIYLIHPEAEVIEGYPVFRSFRDVPQVVDYAYVAVSPQQILAVMPEMRERVRFAQIITSGFGETASGRALEGTLIQSARAAGVRILGPNCLGLYSPRARVTFLRGLPGEGGSAGLLAQSGGLSIDILRRGTQRGVGFSGAVTMGNSADVQPWELLEYFLTDPNTRVVAGYLEDAKNGRKFFETLHTWRGTKPVVLLIGGMTPAGRRVAHSHTGALAGDERIWRGIARQTGLVLVRTVDEMIDVVLTFQTLGGVAGPAPRKVVLFGNGGGASVLGADVLAMNQLELTSFSPNLEQALVDLHLPPGSSIANPIDTPAIALRQSEGCCSAHPRRGRAVR
jgi:acyl-CoA synthetase (NDP forming)